MAQESIWYCWDTGPLALWFLVERLKGQILLIALHMHTAYTFAGRLDLLEDQSNLHRQQGEWCAVQICILERHIARLDNRIDFLEARLSAVTETGESWLYSFGAKLVQLRKLIWCKRRKHGRRQFLSA